MTKVHVAGVGQVRFGKTPERTIEGMGQAAVLAAIKDAGLTADSIQETFCGNVMGGMLTGQRVLRDLGMTGMPIVNVENACSSGSSAVREAVWAIRSGRADVVLALGVEKLSVLGGGTLPLEETDVEVAQGQVMPAVYAMRAKRYLEETGTPVEALAQIAVKARANGARNWVAQFQSAVSLEEVMGSRMIADPLRLLMCCPTGDGAAAVILMSDAAARKYGSKGIRVAGSALASGRFENGYRDMSAGDLTERTGRAAYEDAGIGPGDLDMCELHDAFASAELTYCEALGLCGRGEAAGLLQDGATSLSGRIPVNPSGGLLSRGHALGATGIAQVAEVVDQMLGRAGPRQVARPVKTAVTHCTGGGISGLDHGACAVLVLER